VVQCALKDDPSLIRAPPSLPALNPFRWILKIPHVFLTIKYSSVTKNAPSLYLQSSTARVAQVRASLPDSTVNTEPGCRPTATLSLAAAYSNTEPGYRPTATLSLAGCQGTDYRPTATLSLAGCQGTGYRPTATLSLAGCQGTDYRPTATLSLTGCQGTDWLQAYSNTEPGGLSRH
jgi:hypothetical protein